MLKNLKKNRFFIKEKQAELDAKHLDGMSELDDEDLEEDEFDELEYTGPDEGQVYERYEKIKKSYNSYVKSCEKNGYLEQENNQI